MMLLNVSYLIFCILWALLVTVARAATSLSEAPESVRLGRETVKFLWQKVQAGTFYKWLPSAYEHDEPAWFDFMHTKAEPIIESYYSAIFSTKRLVLGNFKIRRVFKASGLKLRASKFSS